MSSAFPTGRRVPDLDPQDDAAGPSRLARGRATIDSTLFERLVSDLHWSMLHLGALGQLTGACARSQRAWTLKPWRHLLHDNSAAAILTLRYAPELGLPAALAAALTKFEKSLAALQAQTLPYTQPAACARHHELTQLAARWRDLAKQGVDLLNALDPFRSRLLASMFGADARVLVEFLQETAKGDVRRVSEFGEIALPEMAQRRRRMRKPVEHACQVWVEGAAHEAQLSDLSVDGLGLCCDVRLHAGQRVDIAVGERRLGAIIVWSESPRYGLRLERPLQGDDPLIARDQTSRH